MANKRLYTAVSGKAVIGLKRLVPDREVYVSTTPSERGYTVVTKSAEVGRIRDSSARLPA